MDARIESLLKIPDNEACFDCGTPQPKWASVNNSVFVCLNCAGIHRELGVNYTFIRSLTLDNWDDNQIKMLSIGGNNRLKMVLQEFGIPTQIKIDTKYRLNALDYYRKLLRTEAFNEPIPVKPDIVSAFEIVEEEQKDKKQLGEGIVLNSPLVTNPAEANKTKQDNVTDFFGKIGQFFQNNANDIQKNIKDLKIKDKANDFEQKAIAFKNKAVDAIEKKTNVAVTSVSSFWKNTVKFFEQFGENEKQSSDSNNNLTKSSIDLSTNINLKNKEEKDNSSNESKDNNTSSQPINKEDPDTPPQI